MKSSQRSKAELRGESIKNCSSREGNNCRASSDFIRLFYQKNENNIGALSLPCDF